MSTTINTSAVGVSPIFGVTSEEFVLDLFTGIADIEIDGVKPPTFGDDGGPSHAHDLIQHWSYWMDEKIVEPKYDQIGAYLGMPTNRPTYVKDYHILSLFRAVDYIMSPEYDALFHASVDAPTPIGPPPEEEQ